MALKKEHNITKDLFEKRINLLPDIIITRRKQKKQALQIVLLGIIIIAVVSYNMLQIVNYTDRLRIEADASLNRISILKEQQAQQAIISRLEEQIEFKKELVEGIISNNESVSLILGIIDVSLPKGVQFASVNATSEAEIVVIGIGESYEQVADFVHNLKETRAFDDVFLQTINKNIYEYNRTKLETTFDFSIMCKIGGAEDEI